MVHRAMKKSHEQRAWKSKRIKLVIEVARMEAHESKDRENKYVQCGIVSFHELRIKVMPDFYP